MMSTSPNAAMNGLPGWVRTEYYFLILPLLLVAVSNVSVRAADAGRPNIVLIVVDDLGYGDLGCYGSTINRTPNIDRLASKGLRFTDFHSNGPMCTPTRAALLTGRYQQRFGRVFDGPLSGRSNRDQGLPLEAVTIAEVLGKNGYVSACFGKWHLGYTPAWLPTRQGFDVFRGLASGDGDHHTHIARWGREDWWHNEKIVMVDGYTADLLTNYSVEFIEANRDRPFFLYVPHLAIHFPWQGPNDPPHRRKGNNYGEDKWGIIPNPGNVSPHVKAMVEAVDQGVGRIVSAIERLHLDKKTLVIVTSDNGGYLTYGQNFRNISSNGPFRDQKGSVYEGGHRVPAICYWPGKIAPGVTDATTITFDLLPTFAALSGTSTDGLPLDGVDLSPLLLQGKSVGERTLFWRMNREWAVRRGTWKLVCADGENVELYNLDHDVGERNDLAAERPTLVKELDNAWQAWEMDVNASARTYTK